MPETLIKAIDRHAPKGWRRLACPDPKLVVLPELKRFALSSSAFASGHLWNDAWADPDVGFPVTGDRASVKSFATAHPQADGIVHFGPGFLDEVGRMTQMQDVPDYLAGIVAAIRQGADDAFLHGRLFVDGGTVRLRLIAA